MKSGDTIMSKIPFYQTRSVKNVGISILSILSAQILHGILFFGLLYALRDVAGEKKPEVLLLIPNVIAFLGGGFLIGRLLFTESPVIWVIAGFLNAGLPVFYQIFFMNDPWNWLGDPMSWMSWIGGTAIWIVGAWIGKISQEKRPKPEFDGMLFKVTAGIVGFMIVINTASWASIHFSQWYRIAKDIELPLPPNAQELDSDTMDPRIALGRRFEMRVPADDRSIYAFYADYFKSPTYTDVSRIFQSNPPGEWEHRHDQIRDDVLDYQFASAHWRDLTGDVLISLFIQADRVDPTQEWEVSEWKITGIVMTGKYVEPPPPPTATTESSVDDGTATGESISESTPATDQTPGNEPAAESVPSGTPGTPLPEAHP